MRRTRAKMVELSDMLIRMNENMRELQLVDVDHLDMHYWRFHSRTQELEVLEDVVLDEEAEKFLFIGTLLGCLGIEVACMDSLDVKGIIELLKQGKKSTYNGNDCSMYGKCKSSSKNDTVSLEDVRISEESKQVQQESLECMDFKQQDNMVIMNASNELVDAKLCLKSEQFGKNFSRADAYKRYGSINDDSLRDKNATPNLNACHGLMQRSLDASLCADLEDTCSDFARSFDSLRIEKKPYDAYLPIREELTALSPPCYEGRWYPEELWAIGPIWDEDADANEIATYPVSDHAFLDGCLLAFDKEVDCTKHMLNAFIRKDAKQIGVNETVEFEKLLPLAVIVDFQQNDRSYASLADGYDIMLHAKHDEDQSERALGLMCDQSGSFSKISDLKAAASSMLSDKGAFGNDDDWGFDDPTGDSDEVMQELIQKARNRVLGKLDAHDIDVNHPSLSDDQYVTQGSFVTASRLCAKGTLTDSINMYKLFTCKSRSLHNEQPVIDVHSEQETHMDMAKLEVKTDVVTQELDPTSALYAERFLYLKEEWDLKIWQVLVFSSLSLLASKTQMIFLHVQESCKLWPFDPGGFEASYGGVGC